MFIGNHYLNPIHSGAVHIVHELHTHTVDHIPMNEIQVLILSAKDYFLRLFSGNLKGNFKGEVRGSQFTEKSP